ncbi:hypothetical protein IAT38_002123 [Cryptococcus sp. DSM 104549]
MRSIAILPILLSIIALAFTGVAGRSVSNFSLGTPERRGSSSSGSGTYETCVTVSGKWLGYKYNFGCLCLSDVDDYCSANGISSSMKSLINYQISSSGSKKWYPHNAQPTCDGSGGYTCGSLSRTSSGSCGSTNCDPKKTSSNGGCCPRGQTYKDGKCCGSVGCNRGGSKCTPVLTCPTYTSNGICCPSGSSGWTGCATVCCPAGQTEDGSTGKCITSCPTGQTYNSQTKKCESVCDTANGYTHQWTTKGKEICCRKSHKACQTVCCPQDKPEVGSSGKCCPVGSTLASDGSCVSPSPGAGSASRRRRALIGQQIHLGPVDSSPSFGLAANSKGAMCPHSFAACPIDGRDASQYECIDTRMDLQSCGGCASLGQGTDCTAIAGARWMGCSKGKCEVYSCKKGWSLSANGTSCDRR